MADATYETSDLGLAAVLYCSGIEFHGLKLVSGSWQKLMVFTRPPVDILAGWQSGSIEVNALAFWRASRTLKRCLMQAKGQEEE